MYKPRHKVILLSVFAVSWRNAFVFGCSLFYHSKYLFRRQQCCLPLTNHSRLRALQTSHAASSMYSGPGVRTDDGHFTIFVAQDMSRWDMLQLLLDMDSGKHVSRPRVQSFKTKAYRLEPFTEEGIFSLDGEVVEYGPIQAVMKPGTARVPRLVL